MPIIKKTYKFILLTIKKIGETMNQKTIQVKPATGKTIYNEATNMPLSANKYTEVPATQYYLRRIAEGGLKVAAETENETEPKTEKETIEEIENAG